MSLRYLVTGASGFIGQHLVGRLVDEGHDVVALTRNPAKAVGLGGPRVQLERGDITEPHTLPPAMAGCDGVFHLAAWYEVGIDDTARMAAINVDGTRNVLTAMGDLGIPKGVYASSLAAFSDSKGAVRDESFRPGPETEFVSAYDRTKYEADFHVAEPMAEAGLPLTIVMLGVTYGVGDPHETGDFFRDYLRRSLPAYPRDAAFCWSHVSDAVTALQLAMDTVEPGGRYIMAGPCHGMDEVLDVAQDITGIPKPRIGLGRRALRLAADLIDPIDAILPIPQRYTAEALRASTATYLGDNRKAREDLGFDPAPLAVGLRRMLAAEMAAMGLPGAARLQ